MNMPQLPPAQRPGGPRRPALPDQSAAVPLPTASVEAPPPATLTAFAGMQRIASGAPVEVATVLAAWRTRHPDGVEVQVFDDHTGQHAESRLPAAPEGASDPDTAVRTPSADDATPRRGRPRLGVVAREVTLLPRHWAWLSEQRGGASVALRRLVDDARRQQDGSGQMRQAREAAHAFMTALAGDLPGYEEALRALHAGDAGRLEAAISGWPADVRAHTRRLATPGLERPEAPRNPD